MDPQVTIIDEKYILYNGYKYRRLKAKTIKKLSVHEKLNRAVYMKNYRKKQTIKLNEMKALIESIKINHS
jgi:ABC-type lipopolysaccharide export system ATPase subunit